MADGSEQIRGNYSQRARVRQVGGALRHDGDTRPHPVSGNPGWSAPSVGPRLTNQDDQ